MSEYTETLKQSIKNYVMTTLENIMAEGYDETIIVPEIIKSRLISDFERDRRIKSVVNIDIDESNDFYSVTVELETVNGELIEI